jgi:hypothetical protein
VKNNILASFGMWLTRRFGRVRPRGVVSKSEPEFFQRMTGQVADITRCAFCPNPVVRMGLCSECLKAIAGHVHEFADIFRDPARRRTKP